MFPRKPFLEIWYPDMYYIFHIWPEPVFMESDAWKPFNGGTEQLMHYIYSVSSHLPPLDGVDAFDMIDTGQNSQFFFAWKTLAYD